MRSKFLNWNGWDWIKGLIVSMLTSVLIFLQTVVADPTTVSWKQVAIKCAWTAAAAMIAYMLKNLLTNSEGRILTSEPLNPINP